MDNHECILRWRQGEEEMLGLLVDKNMPLIKKLAGRYVFSAHWDPAVSWEDLLQTATMGLIEAAYDWQPERGSFAALAWIKMRKALSATLPNRKGEVLFCELKEPVPAPGSDPLEQILEREANSAVGEALSQSGVTLEEAERDPAALSNLRSSRRVKGLWEMYTGAPWQHKSFQDWKNTRDSATEAAAMRREKLKGRMGFHKG